MSSVRWRNILVAIADPFAELQPGLAKAVAIANRCDATLTLFNTFMVPQRVPPDAYESSEKVLDAAVRQREDRLRKLARKYRPNGGVKCVVRWDYPSHEAIVRQVLRSKPDLLVTESRRHRRLARLVLANTDWELIRSCPCPLWFVRSPKLPRRPKILVAVDPSHAHAKPARLDGLLLRGAQGLVQQLGGSIDMLHAYDVPLRTLSAVLHRSVKQPSLAQDLSEAAARGVHKLAQAHEIEASRCHVKEGAADEVIESSVQQLASDVLVMGAVCRSRLAAPIIGNTAERVIDQVDCDVLVIKPAGFKTQVTQRTPTLALSSPKEQRSAA
jgi:universal stress protein E